MIKPLFQKIVVAVNGSEQSLRAAMYGIMMAKMFKCELKAVYVVDTDTLRQLEMSKFFIAEEVSRYRANLKSDGERYLSYLKRLADEKSVKISVELKEGAVWSELIKSAEEFDADLIVLGGKTNGANSMSSVLRRDKVSAANSEIIGSSKCNVLVVKDADVEKLFKLL